MKVKALSSTAQIQVAKQANLNAEFSFGKFDYSTINSVVV